MVPQWKNSQGRKASLSLPAAANLNNLNSLRFPAGSHNETWACSDYYQTITYFLDEVNPIGQCRLRENWWQSAGALPKPGKWKSSSSISLHPRLPFHSPHCLTVKPMTRPTINLCWYCAPPILWLMWTTFNLASDEEHYPKTFGAKKREKEMIPSCELEI